LQLGVTIVGSNPHTGGSGRFRLLFGGGLAAGSDMENRTWLRADMLPYGLAVAAGNHSDDLVTTVARLLAPTSDATTSGAEATNQPFLGEARRMLIQARYRLIGTLRQMDTEGPELQGEP
jgi:hypothetical protein